MQPQQPSQSPYGPPPSPQPQPSAAPQSVVVPGSAPTPVVGGSAADAYSFIVAPPKPARRSLLAGRSMVFKIIAAVVIVVVILILAVGIKNMLSSKPINPPSLLNVAEDQTELIHLSTAGGPDAVSQDTQNFAITTQLSVTSQQTQLLAYLKSHGVKGNTKQLAVKQSATIDNQLKAANSNSTFDPAFAAVMKTQLTNYQNDLKSAYTLNPGAKARSLLNSDFQAAGLLLTQLSTADTSD